MHHIAQTRDNAIARLAIAAWYPTTAHQVPNYTIETQLFDDLFEGKDVVFMGPEKRCVAWGFTRKSPLIPQVLHMFYPQETGV